MDNSIFKKKKTLTLAQEREEHERKKKSAFGGFDTSTTRETDMTKV